MSTVRRTWIVLLLTVAVAGYGWALPLSLAPPSCELQRGLAVALHAEAEGRGSNPQAQDLSPELADRFSRGVAALKAGELDAAETAFREVLRQGGRRAFVHHNLAIVLQRRGQHADALREFRSAIGLDAAFGPARLLAGVSLLALERHDEAVAELEEAVRLMPGEAVAHVQLAEAYERIGDIGGLVDQYRRLVELQPANGEYRYRLGQAYLRLAQHSFERIREIQPHSARLQQALAGEYLRQGRVELAIQAFQDAARLGPKLPEIHAALARIHLDQGRLDDAAREVELELAVAPESLEARELEAAIEARRR